MNEDILDDIDEAIAQRLLDRITDKENPPTVAELEAARKYLAHKGHVTASPAGMKKAGAKHPALDLAELELDPMTPEELAGIRR